MHLSGAKYLKTQLTTLMLLPDNIHPDYSIYYNGAIVLESLQRDKKYKILDLYQEVKSKREMSLSIFILCLDWLYLLDVVKINSKDELELCF